MNHMSHKSPDDAPIEARIRAHIEAAMRDLGWNQARLASEIGMDSSALGRIRRGERGIGVGLAVRISQAIRVRPSELLLREPEKTARDPGSASSATVPPTGRRHGGTA